MGEFFQTYFDFSIMGDNFNAVLEGFWWTIKLSLIGGAFALAWGLILSVIRQLPGKALAPDRWLAIAYIYCLRGIPMLLTLLLIYGGLGTLQSTGTIPEWLGIPEFFGWPSSFWYGVMALTLTYGAYMAEVYRAGIESIPRGQMEAARSLGMSHGQAMRFVIVPQAIRRVIPPLLNDYIALMKDTSLVSVISLAEVVHVGQDVYSTTFNPSALTLGAIMFLIVTLPLARLVDWQIKRQDEKFQRGLA